MDVGASVHLPPLLVGLGLGLGLGLGAVDLRRRPHHLWRAYRDPTSSWLQPHGSMGDPYVAWNAYGQPLSVRARPVLRQYLF